MRLRSLVRVLLLVHVVAVGFFVFNYVSVPRDQVRLIDPDVEELEWSEMAERATDDPCSDPRANEWIGLAGRYFFKKTASFYFTDVQLLRAHLVVRAKPWNEPKFHLHFRVHLSGLSKVLAFSVFDYKPRQPWFVGLYGSSQLDARFNMSDFVGNFSIDGKGLNVSFFVEEAESGLRTKYPLQLKVKRLLDPAWLERKAASSVNGSFRSLVCLKCVYLGADEHRHLRWWFELNKRVGFDRIVMCNQSIAGTAEFERLFADYADFVSLSQLRCLPDFYSPLKSAHNFLRSFKDLKVNGKFDSLLADVFNVIAVNECYLENVDKYDYVAVMDGDETVVPMVSEHASSLDENWRLVSELETASDAQRPAFLGQDRCDRFERPQASIKDSSRLSGYLKSLRTPELRFHSFYFTQGYFLKADHAALILDALGRYLSSLDISKAVETGNLSHRVLVVDARPLVPDQHVPANVTVLIEGQEELVYASRLVALYERHLSPWLRRHARLLADSSNGRYDRLFVLARNPATLGKTIHNTASTFHFTVHEPLNYMSAYLRPEHWNSSESIAEIGRLKSYHHVPDKDAYLSHFRNVLNLARDSKLRISQIYFDINYFNCYFLPILRSISKEKIAFAEPATPSLPDET